MSATSITSHVTGYTHHITTPINCNTERVIYAWKCTKCKYNFSINSNNKIPATPVLNNIEQASNYIGRTTRKFKKRIYEHTNYVNVRNLEEPSAEHFCKPGHKVHNLQAIGIEKVRNLDPFILKAREHWLIKKFDAFRNGLNQEPWVLPLQAHKIFPFFLFTFWLWRNNHCNHLLIILCCEHVISYDEINKLL